MTKRRIVIEINFNNFGMNPQRLTKEWIENRLSIFHKYTLKSLKKQTNQNFLTVVKLAGGCNEIIDQALSKYDPLPDNVKFGTSIESQRRIEAYSKGYDELFINRIDSDDLYHKTFVQQLFNYQLKPATEVLINQDGYLWDTEGGSMVTFHHPSPSFYTFIYSVKDYLDGKRYKIRTHGYAIKLNHEILKKGNFVNVIHASNQSNKRLQLAKGKRIDQATMTKMLNEFI